MSEAVAKIGVLDSGIGGLSVLRCIHALLPDYPTLYFADQFHLPYGPREAGEISDFTEAITQFLIDRGAVMIVVACNTASAASLYTLRERFPHLPFVGMEPAVKPAAERTRSGVIGVLATRTTANGHLYKQVLSRYAAGVRVLTQVAPELVRIAEEQSQHTPEGRAVITDCLAPLLAAGVDEIALACTHFPFLSDAIQELAGAGVELIDPGPAVARQAARVLPSQVSPIPGQNRYFTSGEAALFQDRLLHLIGIRAPVEVVEWRGREVALPG